MARTHSAAARDALEEAAAGLGAELVHASPEARELAREAHRAHADVVFLEVRDGDDVARQQGDARALGVGLVAGCQSQAECTAAALAGADEWTLLPSTPRELGARLAAAAARARIEPRPDEEADAAELVRYREALHDAATGLPTLPLLIPRIRDWLEEHDRLTLYYLHFVWFANVERVFGAERLDELIATAANAVREDCRARDAEDHLLTLDHAGDEDLVLITRAPRGTERAEDAAAALSERVERLVRERIAEEHGPELASLAGLYIGAASVSRDPKVRVERLVYRAIRDAARAALDVEEWERGQKTERLRRMLREGAVWIEYHPIVVTETEDIYGYEALARGEYRDLRSPEVLFQIAQEANLIWELSRLLRRRAVQGSRGRLQPHQFLFLNVEPHDFEDPTFRELDLEEIGITDPSHVVFEITERVAITDYPRFQQHLAALRAQGFRFAVDDAGSGYAGLGSIANLAPDYIKLDISLISDIDSHFLKQNLVETMVNFAEGQGTQVIAEGVERAEELETIRQIGVHLAQGFYFNHLREGVRPAA